MDTDGTIEALLALGQQTRLAAYRLLVEQGPPGMSVSEIARRLDVNMSTLSRHLAQLERAALLRSWREERQIIYAVDDNGTRALLRFLTEDCCKANPWSCPDEPPGTNDDRPTHRRRKADVKRSTRGLERGE